MENSLAMKYHSARSLLFTLLLLPLSICCLEADIVSPGLSGILAGGWDSSAGEQPVSPGPYAATMGDSGFGSVTIGGPPGTAEPIDFYIDPEGPAWVKEITIDTSEYGLNPGDTIFVSEYILLLEGPNGGVTLTDWDETILSDNWRWGTAEDDLAPQVGLDIPALDLFDFYDGVVSPDGQTAVTFFPGVPIGGGIDGTLEINKALIYTGPPITPSPGTISIFIEERPSIPEPATAGLFLGGLALLLARRQARKHR